jgi:hypothetical protein
MIRHYLYVLLGPAILFGPGIVRGLWNHYRKDRP